MGRGYDFWNRLADEAALPVEAVPGLPIVELAGAHRVLIENHYGVKAYSRERIVVNVKFGQLCICGTGLELMRMTREQLVVHGRIDGISIQRRGSA